jgi:TctA family transporter
MGHSERNAPRVFLGILPGSNPVIASLVCYGLEKEISTPGGFRKGAIEGLQGPKQQITVARAELSSPSSRWGFLQVL